VINTHLAVALVAAAIGAGGAWQVQGWRWRAADADRLELEREARRGQEVQADVAAVRHETKRAGLQQQRQALTQETDRAITAAPDFHAGMCWDDGGLRAIADALGAPADPGEPAPAVRGASAPE
jgi:hypothetical protein